MKARPYPLEPPEPGVEFRLAYRLAAQESGLGARILDALVGRPRRYSDLRGLLKGRSDHNLTVALRRLRSEGLIDQRLNLADGSYSYELAPLGAHVWRALGMVQSFEGTLARVAAARPARRSAGHARRSR